jgi:hypothetical protein
MATGPRYKFLLEEEEKDALTTTSAFNCYFKAGPRGCQKECKKTFRSS